MRHRDPRQLDVPVRIVDSGLGPASDRYCRFSEGAHERVRPLAPPREHECAERISRAAGWSCRDGRAHRIRENGDGRRTELRIGHAERQASGSQDMPRIGHSQYRSAVATVELDRVLLCAGKTARIYRPSATVFLLTKIRRLGEQDLDDCLGAIAWCEQHGESVDRGRVTGALAALAPTTDAALAARRRELGEALAR